MLKKSHLKTLTLITVTFDGLNFKFATSNQKRVYIFIYIWGDINKTDASPGARRRFLSQLRWRKPSRRSEITLTHLWVQRRPFAGDPTRAASARALNQRSGLVIVLADPGC